MDSAIYRIIDANLNRAREGLRVLEEHARLALEDEGLTARIKGLRHDLASVAHAFGPEVLLAARDIQHDIGTKITVESEQSRADEGHVASAAAKRAAESLRTIEEYGKVLQPQAAVRVEQIRYAVYAVEQEIGVCGPRRRRLRAAQLHVLLTESLCRRPWLEACEQTIAGGADVIQLREKTLSDRELLARARQLRELTRRYGVLLFVNDRPDIARLVEADGVHVGQEDLSVSDARRIVGPAMLVGASTHSLEEARTTLVQRPDYLAVGPMFASGTKPGLSVQGPRLLSEILALTDLPVVAIGGITAANIAILLMHRVTRVAVCQAVIAADNPQEATQGIKQALRATQ